MRWFVHIVALTTASALSAQSTPVALRPIGASGWSALDTTTDSRVARRFDGDATSLTVVLQGAQIFVGPNVELIEEGALPAMEPTGPATIAMVPGGTSERVAYGIGIDPKSGRRHIQMNGNPPLFVDLAKATTVQFALGRRAPIVIPTAGMDAALVVLRSCQRREAERRGLDMAKVDAIMVPARRIDAAAPPIRLDTYPNDTAKRRQGGTVEAAWMVDVTGRPRDCRIVLSSQVASLDDATCAGLMKGAGRYQPARNAAGEPVEMPQWSRVVWSAPAR